MLPSLNKKDVIVFLATWKSNNYIYFHRFICWLDSKFGPISHCVCNIYLFRPYISTLTFIHFEILIFNVVGNEQHYSIGTIALVHVSDLFKLLKEIFKKGDRFVCKGDHKTVRSHYTHCKNKYTSVKVHW